MPERAGAPPVVDAKSLGLVWPDGTPALAGISLEVAAGEKLALLGPNGAGKSTLLRLLAGRLRAASGKLLLFGENDLEAAQKRVALPAARTDT